MRATYKQRVLRDLELSRDNERRLASVIHELVNNAIDLGHDVVVPEPEQWTDAASFAEQRLRLVRLADVNALQRDNEELRAKLAAAEAKPMNAPTAKVAGPIGQLFNPQAYPPTVVGAVKTAAGLNKTPEQIRRETLEKVIDALNLDAYRGYQQGPFAHLFILEGGRPKPDADRFWSDIVTTLRVRKEDAEAEADEAAAARIDSLLQRTLRDEWDAAGETILSGDENGIDE